MFHFVLSPHCTFSLHPLKLLLWLTLHHWLLLLSDSSCFLSSLLCNAWGCTPGIKTWNLKEPDLCTLGLQSDALITIVDIHSHTQAFYRMKVGRCGNIYMFHQHPQNTQVLVPHRLLHLSNLFTLQSYPVTTEVSSSRQLVPGYEAQFHALSLS